MRVLLNKHGAHRHVVLAVGIEELSRCFSLKARPPPKKKELLTLFLSFTMFFFSDFSFFFSAFRRGISHSRSQAVSLRSPIMCLVDLLTLSNQDPHYLLTREAPSPSSPAGAKRVQQSKLLSRVSQTLGDGVVVSGSDPESPPLLGGSRRSALIKKHGSAGQVASYCSVVHVDSDLTD